jgi:hypothetical protein
MAWRTAFGIGLLVAVVCHLAFIFQTTSSLYVWPGMLAHFLITGLHGGTGALEAVADIAEIIMNATFWAFLIRGASRLGKNARNLD